MADLTDSEILAALQRGMIAAQSEPRALSVRYDTHEDRVIVELTNGCTIMCPPALIPGLEDASVDELKAVELLGAGYGLHWETLDVDLSVPGLLASLFGQASGQEPTFRQSGGL